MSIDPFRLTLSEIIDLDTDDAFDDALRMLHDEEHESDDPKHLRLFAELVAHEARTPALDDAIVVPFLVRFVWEKPFPNYTLGAWRALFEIVDDHDSLEDVAWEILSYHPHGELRAEVLTAHSGRYPDYLESERFLALATKLRTEDASPRVRVNAIELLDLLGSAPVDSEAEVLMRLSVNDPATEVRCCAFQVLSRLRLEQSLSARRRLAQEAALRDPNNRYVVHTMLSAYLRTGNLYTDVDRAAFGISFIARERTHPFYREMIGIIGWQIPDGAGMTGPVALFWLDDAPFESGAALAQHWLKTFEDPTVPIDKRSHALVCLTTADPRRIRGLEKVALAFYFDEHHTPDSLVDFTSARALMRVFFLFPKFPGVHDKTRVELSREMLARACDFESDRDVSAAYCARRYLVERIVEAALHLREADPEREELLSLAFVAVRDDANDISFALYDIRNADTHIDMTPLCKWLAATEDRDRAYGIAEHAAVRYAKTFDRSALDVCLTALTCAKWPSVIPGILNALPSYDDLEHDAQGRTLLAEALAAFPSQMLDEWIAEDVQRWLNDRR